METFGRGEVLIVVAASLVITHDIDVRDLTLAGALLASFFNTALAVSLMAWCMARCFNRGRIAVAAGVLVCARSGHTLQINEGGKTIEYRVVEVG